MNRVERYAKNGVGMARCELMVACAVCAAVCHGRPVQVFDFETDAERRAIAANSVVGVTLRAERAFAASGEWSLHFACPSWQEGQNAWPSFTLTPRVTDWRGYDRMVVDVVNRGGPGNIIAFYAAEAKGPIQNGIHSGHLPLPAKGWTRLVVPLGTWPKTADPAKVARFHVYTDRPPSLDVFIDNVVLLKPGEEAPLPGDGYVRDLLPIISEACAEAEARAEGLARIVGLVESRERLRALCRERGMDVGGMIVGWATAMEKVRPDAAFRQRPADAVTVRLAKGEHESVQILVTPAAADLRNVGVRIAGSLKRADGAEFAASNVSVSVTGYVRTRTRPTYGMGENVPDASGSGSSRRVKPVEPGWWPDPILDQMTACDIAGRDVQSFWVRVRCPHTQDPGVYSGRLDVVADGMAPVRIPFSVRVNGFALDRVSPIPLMVTFSPIVSDEAVPPDVAEARRRMRTAPECPAVRWREHRLEWGRFLADYFLTSDSIAMEGVSYDDHPHPDFEVLEQLDAEGRLGCFNLGYWHCIGTGPDAEAKWREATIPRIRRAYAAVKARGWLDKAYLYGCDELRKDTFPRVRRALEILKGEFPDVPFVTTAYDRSYGTGDSPLAAMDWFTPLTEVYDPVRAAQARAKGKRVGWYICCAPKAPYANMFVESAAIEGRLLMGAMSARMRPDSFLYYQTSIWNMDHPLSKGPYTDWEPRSFGSTNGDGSWTCVGPGQRPLATIRLENFRDGLEDLMYVRLVEKRLAAHGREDDWSRRAKALIAVPDRVMRSMTDYTDDPDVLLAWRNDLADLLESTPPVHH